MSSLRLSYKHMLLYSILLLFLISFIESILVFHVTKINSEEYVYEQARDCKSIKLDGIFLKITPYHNCINNNYTDSFYEIKVINNSNRDIKNWTINIELNNKAVLRGAWNSHVTISDKTITILPVSDITNNIKSKSYNSFEIYLKHLTPIDYEKITLTGNLVTKLSNFPLHIINLIIGSIIIVALIIYSIVYKSMKREIDVLNRITRRSYTIIDQTMKTFVNFIDAKDEYTRGHSTRVAEYSRKIAKRMGYDEQYQQDIYYMGLMHDIGKITIPDSILNKTTHLTPDEWAVIQMHTSNGANLLRNFTIIPEIRDAVLYHHERYDGKGYLAQLKGEEIPLCARIICVADSYDAMSTNRCYRLKYSKERIIKEFERCSAKQFDPTIASIMIELITDGTI